MLLLFLLGIYARKTVYVLCLLLLFFFCFFAETWLFLFSNSHCCLRHCCCLWFRINMGFFSIWDVGMWSWCTWFFACTCVCEWQCGLQKFYRIDLCDYCCCFVLLFFFFKELFSFQRPDREFLFLFSCGGFFCEFSFLKKFDTFSAMIRKELYDISYISRYIEILRNFFEEIWTLTKLIEKQVKKR